MIKKEFKVQAKLWRWPGDVAWHFINIDKKISAQIRFAYPKGFVKITAKVGKTTWDTSLFPQKESRSYLLSIKAQVRNKVDLFEGDLINFNFKIR